MPAHPVGWRRIFPNPGPASGQRPQVGRALVWRRGRLLPGPTTSLFGSRSEGVRYLLLRSGPPKGAFPARKGSSTDRLQFGGPDPGPSASFLISTRSSLPHRDGHCQGQSNADGWVGCSLDFGEKTQPPANEAFRTYETNGKIEPAPHDRGSNPTNSRESRVIPADLNGWTPDHLGTDLSALSAGVSRGYNE